MTWGEIILIGITIVKFMLDVFFYGIALTALTVVVAALLITKKDEDNDK